MKHAIVLIAFLGMAMQVSAQTWQHISSTPLGSTAGDFVWQTGVVNTTTNNFYQNTWLVRSANGSGWNNTHLVDGISIDDSYDTPTTARAWWKREPSNGRQFWGDGANTYMTLHGNKLGIGTMFPSSWLDVNVGTQSGITTALSVYRNGDPNLGVKLMTGAGDDASFGNWNGGLASWNGIAFHCTLDNTTRGMFDTRNGNFYVTGKIGIGIANPDEKLTVKGKIHAQEIKVDLNSPINPPDYVFEKDYDLATLSEIEAYIDQNKHLPEIPSAKEMQANGVLLLEMNMLLLKKVEELTLYVIDQQKQIDDLKSKLK